MGLNYSFHIGIGFVIPFKDVLEAVNPFLKTTTEIFHMEDRYDPKTGEKLQPSKIIDIESESYYEFDNIKFNHRLEFLDYFFHYHEVNFSSDIDENVVYLTIKIEHTGEDDVECGRMSAGDSVLYTNAFSKESQLAIEKIEDFITKELRFVPPEPKIFIENYIG